MRRFEVTAFVSVAVLAIACDGFVPATAADGGATVNATPAGGANAVAQSLASGTTPAAAAANQPAGPPAPGPTLQVALAAAQAAIQACTALSQKIGVTVLDSAGVPKVVLGTDGASARGVQSSTNKALTALAFNSPTSELGEKSKSDTVLAGKLAANPIYNARAGGLVIQQGGAVIGAIGVGGAQGSEKDEACAKAGLVKLAGP